ncbi:MAG: polysaccharide export protein, partial [Burkholderiales bacterium]|nr:polysaccharide export protein [Burkholderiales bacterium]
MNSMLGIVKRVACLALVFLALGAHAQATPPESDSLPSGAALASGDNRPTQVSSYKLAAGDVITILVFGEDEFTKEKIRLNDAGSVMFPGLGEVNVLGQTIGDLERLITNGLKGRILVNPKVAVQIVEYRPFYINGMVEKPGSYPYQPGLTVRKAASLAGGFKERAALNKIHLIRENDPGQRPQKVDLNTVVGPGDILTV